MQIKTYIVHSLQSPGPKWKPVNEQPLPRPAAVAIVAQQWAEGRKARAVPTN